MTIRSACFGLIICAAVASCVPQHKIIYVQSAENKKDLEYSGENGKNIRIQSFDLLFISIISSDPKEDNFLAREKQNFTSISEATLAVLSYTVNDSGAVFLPGLGSFVVKGLTLEGAAGTIRTAAAQKLSDPMVSVRFVNTTITILGEVARPGTYPYTNDRLTIFRALGLAGDINEYGNRKKVVLIREKDRKIHKYNLDLTKDDLFNSDFYYLRPNDVVYIQPLKIRRFGMKEYPFALVVSTISSVLLLLYYVKK
jgi:polysaccharide export outer membrane protein